MISTTILERVTQDVIRNVCKQLFWIFKAKLMQI